MVIIVASCLPETYCYYEHYNEKEQYMGCTLKALQCILAGTVGITTCLYDVGSDVFIEWYQHGIYIENYDYISIAWNVLECNGIDEWTLNYIKKNIWG
jgi:hypothetical protein